ncbi:LysR substrate-binding domain-containing protein [Paraburkholderia atlantica]|uniref:LysR substrate-binding domain-containing protein n=1 Tax=Paraburkholderia atlantica TaxID=2654982 RepID=UPI0035D4E5C2
MLDLEREARAKLRGAPLRGLLRVGASEDFAGAWLPQVLQRFRQRHPEATIDLKVGITADLLRQQERGRLDLVFRQAMQPRRRLVFESSSMAGCLSAARAGFAVTVIADSQRVEGLRLVGRKEGLPALPVVRFYAFPRSDSPACADLIAAARRAGQQGRFSPRALRG